MIKIKKAILVLIFIFPISAFSLILNEQNNFLKLPPKPSAYFLQTNDDQSTRFYPIKLVDDFDDTTDAVYSWWDGDGTEVYKREWDGSTKRSGKNSMKVNYKKGSSRYKFSFFAFQPNQNGVDNDFSKYEKLIFFLKTEKPLELIVKIQDKKGKTYEEKFSFEGKKDWQLVEFNLSKAEKVNLKKIDNVFFFVQPGKYKVKGTFWLDDIYLITKQEIIDKTPATPQIEEFKEEDGVWTLRWQDVFDSGARLYEVQMANEPQFKNPVILYTENNYLEFCDEPAYDYYRVRAWSNLPEHRGKSSEFSKVWGK